MEHAAIEHVAEVSNHWWWRPGWREGRHFYACHLSFEGHPDLQKLVDQYQDAVRGFPILDLIPRTWLHLTMEGIGFTDEISDAELHRIESSLRSALAAAEQPRVIFDQPVIAREALYLPAHPAESIRTLRRLCRAAIAEARGGEPDLDTIDNPRAYRPHVSLAYVNADGPAEEIARALQQVKTEPVAMTITHASLLVFHRDRRMYEWTDATPIPIGRR